MSNTLAADLDKQRETVAELLRSHGITPTPQRVEIGSIVFSRPAHLSAEQVLSQVNERDPVVSKATVYNTLGLFAARGLVRALNVDSAKVFYDSNTTQHYHLYDVNTGELQDVDCGNLMSAVAPTLPPGVEVEGVDVIVRIRQRSSKS